VVNGITGSGFFVDGSRNVDKSTAGSRAPLFSGNLIDRNQTGVNLGRLAWEAPTASSICLFSGRQLSSKIAARSPLLPSK
jgi:hypothetical protein